VSGAAWCLLGAGALLLAWQGLQAQAEAQALQRQREHVASLQRGAARATAAAAPSATALAQQREVEALAAYLATPWEPLLQVFESKAGTGVLLLRFAPDAGTGRIEVGGRANSLPALSRYLLALEDDGRLRDILLRHHEAVREATAGTVDFTLTAAWGPAAGPVQPPVQAVAAAPAPLEAQP
jgi:hypothetical protein